MVYHRHVFLFLFWKKMPFQKSFTTIKILRENLQDLGLDKEFLDMAQKAQLLRKEIYKLDFTKIKNFCSEDIIRGWKDRLQTGETNICNNFTTLASQRMEAFIEPLWCGRPWTKYLHLSTHFKSAAFLSGRSCYYSCVIKNSEQRLEEFQGLLLRPYPQGQDSVKPVHPQVC